MTKNKILSILFTDNKKIGFPLLLGFTILYIVNSTESYPYYKFPLIILAFTIFFLSNKMTLNAPLWIVLSLLLLFDLGSSFLWEANHHFLLFYISILMSIWQLKIIDEGTFQKNMGYLLFIVMLASGLQKAFSPSFMSGDYYTYMLNNGSFFSKFLFLNATIYEKATRNIHMIHFYHDNPENWQTGINLQDVSKNVFWLGSVLSWLTVISELMIAIFILIRPQRWITHFLLYFLLIGIFFMRLETGFLSLLSIMGLLISKNNWQKLIYFSLAIIFISFTISKIGHY